MSRDVQHSGSHWLRPRPPPHFGSYTRGAIGQQDRRHFLVTPCSYRTYLVLRAFINQPGPLSCAGSGGREGPAANPDGSGGRDGWRPRGLAAILLEVVAERRGGVLCLIKCAVCGISSHLAGTVTVSRATFLWLSLCWGLFYCFAPIDKRTIKERVSRLFIG